MRILYDHQGFTIQRYGGISRYFYELINQLMVYADVRISVSLKVSNNGYIANSGWVKPFPFFPGINANKKVVLMKKINEAISLQRWREGDFDVFHPTYYDLYYLKYETHKPVVITFHDLIHEKFLRSDRETLLHKRKALIRADRVIAISSNSKNDLISYYSVPEDKIKVIPLASSLKRCTDGLDQVSQRYLLFVGNRDRYKNFDFFITSIASLLTSKRDLFLYCAGGGAFTRDERSLLHDLRLEKKVRLFPIVSDEKLEQLYTNALAFLFPSLYEGFGIPLLEAMNCGCPIGSSGTSALPEVAGNAALYFDPTDRDAILHVAETLVEQPSVRSALKANGEVRAKEFSWNRTAQKTYLVYQDLVL